MLVGTSGRGRVVTLANSGVCTTKNLVGQSLSGISFESNSAASLQPSTDWNVCIYFNSSLINSLGQKKKILDLGFLLHRAVLYRYQGPPKKISNL